MAVAARGLRKESFVERRYNYSTTETDNSPEASRKRTSIPLQQFSEGIQASRDHKVEIAGPPPTHISRSRTPRDKFEPKTTDEQLLQLGNTRPAAATPRNKAVRAQILRSTSLKQTPQATTFISNLMGSHRTSFAPPST